MTRASGRLTRWRRWCAREALEQYPAIKDALNKLSPLITTEEITALNWKVDGDKQEYTDVAKAWLQEKGLIE